MKNLLQKLYYGELCPAEQCSPQTAEQQRIYQENYTHYKAFITELENIDPKLSKRFVSIMDEQLDTFSLEASESFISGFCLGARLMTEIYQREAVSSR